MAIGCTAGAARAGGPTGGTCPGDINQSGAVDVQDLLILLGAWGPNPGHPADLDGSGAVDVQDLLILLGAWGPCPVEPISEAYAITFLESVMNGVFHKFGYSVLNTSAAITDSLVSSGLTHVDADLTFLLRRDDGELRTVTGSGSIDIQRPAPASHLLDLEFQMADGDLAVEGTYAAEHDLSVPALEEQIVAQISDGGVLTTYAISKFTERMMTPEGFITTISADVNQNGEVSKVTIIEDETIIDAATSILALSASSSSAGAGGSASNLSAQLMLTVDGEEQVMTEILALELTRSGQSYSLSEPGFIATWRQSGNQYAISSQLALTNGEGESVVVTANGFQWIMCGAAAGENCGWSWKSFAKSVVVTAAGGAAGGAVVGGISTDGAAPIGVGAGAGIGALGGAVTGAVGYAGSKAWDWAFGPGILPPGSASFSHVCHFGGQVTAHQAGEATVTIR